MIETNIEGVNTRVWTWANIVAFINFSLGHNSERRFCFQMRLLAAHRWIHEPLLENHRTRIICFVITRVTHTQSEWTTDLIYSLATDCPYNSDEDY